MHAILGMKKWILVVLGLFFISWRFNSEMNLEGKVSATFLPGDHYLPIRNFSTNIALPKDSTVKMGVPYKLNSGAYEVYYEVLSPGRGWRKVDYVMELKSDHGRRGGIWGFSEQGADIDYVLHLGQEPILKRNIRNDRRVYRRS
ncbi:hypothetical protein [Persicobacter diffluens]